MRLKIKILNKKRAITPAIKYRGFSGLQSTLLAFKFSNGG